MVFRHVLSFTVFTDFMWSSLIFFPDENLRQTFCKCFLFILKATRKLHSWTILCNEPGRFRKILYYYPQITLSQFILNYRSLTQSHNTDKSHICKTMDGSKNSQFWIYYEYILYAQWFFTNERVFFILLKDFKQCI